MSCWSQTIREMVYWELRSESLSSSDLGVQTLCRRLRLLSDSDCSSPQRSFSSDWIDTPSHRSSNNSRESVAIIFSLFQFLTQRKVRLCLSVQREECRLLSNLR